MRHCVSCCADLLEPNLAWSVYMIAEYKDAIPVQILLRPRDHNRLKKVVKEQRKHMTEFIRPLVLAELDRAEGKKEMKAGRRAQLPA